MYVLGPNNAIVALDAATGKAGLDPSRGRPPHRPRHQLLAEQGRRRPPPHLRRRQLPSGDQRPHRRHHQHLRQRRPRRSAHGRTAPPGRSHRHAGTRLREPDPPRLRARRRLRLRPRRSARLRRAHRQARLDLPHHSASRRVRLRHLAAGRLEVRRRRQHLGRNLGRREARHRLLPDRLADLRLLRRRPHRRQPLRRLPDRARRTHRQAAVALPGRPPRPLGLRPHHRPQAAHREAQRQDRSTSSRSPPSSASYMFSTASPAKPLWPIEERPVPEERRARRAVLADAAVPDLADAVHPSEIHRGRHQSLHRGRGQGPPARDPEERPQRGPLHAARHPQHHRHARRTRRQQLGRRRGGPRNRLDLHPLARCAHHAHPQRAPAPPRPRRRYRRAARPRRVRAALRGLSRRQPFRRTRQSFRRIVRKGRGQMPGFNEIAVSPQDLDAIVAYLAKPAAGAIPPPADAVSSASSATARPDTLLHAVRHAECRPTACPRSARRGPN